MTAKERLEERVFDPLLRTSRGFYLLLAVLIGVMGWAAYAYSYQNANGLYVTGMRDRVFWGLYFSLFVYFLGISGGVTLISSFLRLSGAKWRAPITRGAEMLTIAALIAALLSITMNMSQIPRMFNVMLYGRWESQLVWDVYAIVTALAGRIIYLNMAMIRDLALCRDRIGDAVAGWHRFYFKLFAVGWTGNEQQVRILKPALKMMTIIIVPVAFMSPTVSSWIFSMMSRVPWDSPMFGIYFAAGAVYSGLALMVLLLAITRRVYRLEEFITRTHFLHLGYILAGFATLMLFFTISDVITLGYKMAGSSTFYLKDIVSGGLSNLFWTYVWGGLVFPIALIVLPATRTITGVVVAAIAATIGILFEWYFVVIAGSRIPLNPYDPPVYTPTWVEWSIAAGVVALFVMIMVVSLKLIPVVSIWEMEESEETMGSIPESPVSEVSA